MALKGKRAKTQEIHRASASKHDLYSAMGDTADFDESFEPELGDVGPSVAQAAGAHDAEPSVAAAGAQVSDAPAGSAGANAGVSKGSFSAGAPEVTDVSPASLAPSRFQLLYESRDGKVAVFEDEHGHIVAVDAKRLV